MLLVSEDMRGGEFPSETSKLVEDCVQHVRKTACLDDEPVLPPLSRRSRPELAAFARTVGDMRVMFDLRTAGTWPAMRAAPAAAPMRAHAPRWPVLVCAFVAFVAAVASVAASPSDSVPAIRGVARALAEDAAAALDHVAEALR